MANLPRLSRTRQRLAAMAPSAPAAIQPIAESKPEILPSFVPSTQTLQPLQPTTPALPSSKIESPLQLPSPPRKAASPEYGASLTRVDSPPAAKAIQSPPVPPTKNEPPLSPLTLPRAEVISGNGTTTTTQPRIQPVVEGKGVVYNKTVEKPTKSDRPSEYSSGKSHQKQHAAEVINLNGHNVGAVMEINKSSSGYRLGGSETVKKNEAEGDGDRRKEKKKGKKKKPPMTTFMNTNFQSVNNSVLYDSRCNHRDPGLHLAFSKAADGDGHKSYNPKSQ